MLVWIDFETSGLKPPGACPLEAAVAITDDDLNVLDHHSWLITPLDPPSNWPAKVQEMHTKNGLIRELQLFGGRGIPEVEAGMCDFVKNMEAIGVPLAGSTVGFDRKFIEAFFPAFDQLLHYRSVDVSSIKELAKRWYPNKELPTVPDEDKAHRSLPDVIASIDELRWYRENIFIL